MAAKPTYASKCMKVRVLNKHVGDIEFYTPTNALLYTIKY